MTRPNIEPRLEQLGFMKNEIKVYLTLLEQGPSRAGEIIGNIGLHRNLVYTSLERLVEKGLVAKLNRKNVAVFEVTTPDVLVEMAEKQKSLAQDLADELKKTQREAPREIRIFEGIEGVIQARERSLSLQPDETVYVLGGTQLSLTAKYEPHWMEYHNKRIANNVNCKLLFDASVPQEYVAARNALPRTEAKYLPFNTDLPALFDIYGDCLTITVPGKDPLSFSLRSREAAKSMKTYFEYLWNQEITVETGNAALRSALSKMLDGLQAGESYCVLGATPGKDVAGLTELYDEFHAQRIKRGIVVNMLAFADAMDFVLKRFTAAGDKDLRLSHVKPFVSEPKNPAQVYLANGRAFMCIMGETPTVIHFKRPEIYQSFKTYFDSLWNQEAYVLRGAEALKNIWLEGIEAKEIRFIGARGYFMDRFPKLFEEVQRKAEATPGVSWRIVTDRGVKGHKVTTFPWSKTKYIFDTVKSPNVVWLYGDKVVIANWTEKEPILFVSENKHLAQSYNDYFEALWKQA
ncbi:MAG: helix-turn-helix domain-containing protein [Patescibacteria group bacterium]